ncbi:hypothetical protein SRS16CHR_02275 [Variovorax sp. SRS16]|uniref:FHA domain-containing protein n=1 Tax=Variovorax sp. SRS16 TaxID=282217 RepID=UPI0013178020|nr:FHA domain-containing protein [Variovorax sp. SRS16]VTU18649.1 hypothetical protein SRS16CHR_02275 [Variovorax sp. SRS16]
MSRLIVLARHNSVKQVNIRGPLTTIGRDPACGVHIDSRGVSRHHVGDCQLRFLYDTQLLPREEALRLATVFDDFMDTDAARQGSLRAAFFSRGNAPRYA